MEKLTLIALTALTAGLCFGACPQYDVTDDCWVGLEDIAAVASEWLTGNRQPVPRVLDMTQAEAERAIIAAGLTVGVVYAQFSERVAEDDVISQDPSSDEFLAAEEAVSMVVSLGPWYYFANPPDMTWLYIYDNGSGMKDVYGEPIEHGGFTGFMSKYETTNAQYCKFLNDALSAGFVEVSADSGYVIGTAEEYYGGEYYYYLSGSGLSSDGATNGGAAKINYDFLSNEFTVDGGYENYPVTYVSWYGAMAFAKLYGWRLPTEWQWQAVADYDGTYEWGCGPIIHNGMANYSGSYHPAGTITVGAFGPYGYGMCDMAGNVGEWTSSSYAYGSQTIRDSYWGMLAYWCRVAHRPHGAPSLCGYSIGFRVVMDL